MNYADIARILPKVISAAPEGKIVGRIRLQKIFYLLQQMGLNSDLKFSYYHYGPYADELATSVDFAKYVDGSVDERPVEAVTHGGTYSIFSAPTTVSDEDGIGDIPSDRLVSALKVMNETTSVVIELAATAHWLRHVEEIDDWRATIRARKGRKAMDANLARAEKLLSDLGLAL